MKKTITKLLILILVSIFLINFGVMCNISFANIEAEGVINVAANLIGGVISIVFYLKKLMVVIAAFCVNIITAFIGKMDGVINNGDSEFLLLTPFQLFFNKLQITDVNFFDLSVGSDTVSYKIRTTVSSWFYVMRLISSAVLLLILIYIGIRMAISTVAEDKARYKKMLFDWGASLALVFVLQYIIIFTVYANTAIINALERVATNTDITGVINDIALNAAVGIGINSITSAVVYCMLALQILGLLIAYINRMLKVAFLIIISPLISITYSIDKMGDGKSQALDTWLKEYVYTILIQPFHCIMYIGLIGVAFNLINNGGANVFEALGNYNQLANGILAILCVKFIKDAEEIVRKIFGFKDDNSTTSMAAGMALTMVVANKAQNLGKSARVLGNKAGNFAGKLGGAIGKDASNIGNHLKGKFGGLKEKGGVIGKAANTVGDGASKIGGLAKTAGTKVGNMKTALGESNLAKKAIKGIKSGAGLAKSGIGKFTGSKLGKFIMKRNSPASAFGIALGAMAYGSGTTSALQAIGMENAGKQGAQSFMDTSSSHIANEIDTRAEKSTSRAKEMSEDYKQATADLESADKDLKAAYGEYKDDKTLEQEIAGKQQELQVARESRTNIEKPLKGANKGTYNGYYKKAKKADKDILDKSRELKKLQERKASVEKLKKKRDEIEERKNTLEAIVNPSAEAILQEMDYTGSNYGEGSKELERILTDIRAVLINMGQEDKAETLIKRITVEISLDPKGFDLSSVLDGTIDPIPEDTSSEYYENYESNRQLLEARAMALEMHSYKAQIYQLYNTGKTVGIEQKTIVDKINKRVERREKKNKKAEDK